MERSAHALMHRFAVIAADVLIVFGAYLGGLLLRLAGNVPATYWSKAGVFVTSAAAAYVLVNAVFGAYSKDSTVRRVALAGLLTGMLVIVVNLSTRNLPLSVALFGAIVSLLGFVAVRVASRAWGWNAAAGTIDS